ncbi:MAG TPA: FAD-dependent oxidoreductase [Devosiaceae bacterium]
MTRVVVAGGGTAGFAAAIAAAEAGAEVTLLEQQSYLGGTMTGGLVPGIVSMRHQPWRDEETLVQLESSYAGTQVVRGVAQRLVDRLNASGGAYTLKDGEAPVRVLFDPELMKWLIDQMVREAGVRILYNTKVTGVRKDGNTIVGVELAYGEYLSADVVIDATGDGHIANFAGAGYEQGEGNDATYVQPISMYFLMGGVDMGKSIAFINANIGSGDFTEAYVRKLNELYEKKMPLTLLPINSIRERAAAEGKYPIPFGTTTLNPRAHTSICRPVFRGGEVRYDITMHNVDMAYRVDATDTETLSEAIGSMRDFTVRTAHYFKEFVPGFENAYLLQVADIVGVRETRRIVGDYTLTGSDVLDARTFRDAIGYCGATVDVHNVEGGKELTRMSAIREGKSYQVPYGIMLPKGIENLLVAGRCVSADRVACGSIRQQAGCLVTGQGAGIAAALAGKAGITPRELDIDDLQSELRRQGAQL